MCVGCQFKTPGETRWNSKFDAAEDILSRDHAQLHEAVSNLQLEVLDEKDRMLLQKYLVV